MSFLRKHYLVIVVMMLEVDYFDEDYTLDDFVASIDALPVSPRGRSLAVNTTNFAVAPKLSSSDRVVVTPTPDVTSSSKPKKGSNTITIAALKQELDELKLQVEELKKCVYLLKYEKN